MKTFVTKLVFILGFSSRRKYGFLHSSWEVIKARKTGTTHTRLDYVVFRLFYALALSGISVFTLTELNPVPLFLYFETCVIMTNTLYAFTFLRQVLAHNHHRRALGRRQRMPEQLIITDEIERGGQKYYISKKISILPMHSLSAYEKLVWTCFNISSTMSIASFLSTRTDILKRRDKYKLGMTMRSVMVNTGFIMTLVDLVTNTIPMRAAHVIHPLIFTGLYFCIDKIYEVSQPNKQKWLYITPTWEFPVCLYLILFVIISHVIVVLLSIIRDFLISMLDKSRNQSTQQKVRTQKRLARRKIMHEILGPDGTVERIVLEHLTPSQEDFICWKEGHPELDDGQDWAGDSDSDPGDHLVTTKGETKEPPVYRYTKVNENIPPPPLSTQIKPKFELTKPVVIKLMRSQENLDDIQLPTPPKTDSDTQVFKIRKPRVKRLIKAKKPESAENTMRSKRISAGIPKIVNINPPTSLPSTSTQQQEKRKSSNYDTLYKLPDGDDPLVKAFRREYKAKRQKGALSPVYQGKSGKQKKITLANKLDSELKHEHREYTKHHQEHEIDRITYHNQFDKELKKLMNEAAELPSLTPPPPHLKEKEYTKHAGILKTQQSSRKPHQLAQKRMSRIKKGAPFNPVYDPLTLPNITNVTSSFHYLDAKLDRRGEEAKVPPEHVPLYYHHPGVQIHHDKIDHPGHPIHPPPGHPGYISTPAVLVHHSEPPPSKDKSKPDRIKNPEQKESVVTFHPLIQFYDVPEVHQAPVQQTAQENSHGQRQNLEQYRIHPDASYESSAEVESGQPLHKKRRGALKIKTKVPHPNLPNK